MVGRKGLLDIPADLRGRILNLKSHSAIEIQCLASGQPPDVGLKLIGQLTNSKALGSM